MIEHDLHDSDPSWFERELPTGRQGAPSLASEKRIPLFQDTVCWVCAGPTFTRHCKLICSNCGYTRDCSDP